ncbi:MAG: YceD family protein [Mycobacteriales bacterium]
MATPLVPRHLDPRGPLVYDTRVLGRRPGTMRTLVRQVPAGADWGLPLLAVPGGEPVELDLRLEAVVEGVLVSGSVRAPLQGTCGRCLEPFVDTVVVDVQELFTYTPIDADFTTALDGDLLNLEPALRDAVVLALPLKPLCRPDCAGLCSRCGARLEEVGADHHHDEADPRWAALGSLINDKES